MSLDGYVTGPGADEQHGLGDAPELHTWVTEQDAVDTEILERATAQSGAVVMGRRLFDIVDGPGGWNEEMGYGADQTGTPPFFVVTHSPPRDVRLERDLGMRFTFVSDLVTAIDRARSAATHGDVVIMGGGDVIGTVDLEFDGSKPGLTGVSKPALDDMCHPVGSCVGHDDRVERYPVAPIGCDHGRFGATEVIEPEELTEIVG